MSQANGRTLYRIPQSGKVAGVCAGIADYFNFETWLVRVAAASKIGRASCRERV